MKEFQVLVYDDENSILSSQHFDEEPNEQLLDELIFKICRVISNFNS